MKIKIKLIIVLLAIAIYFLLNFIYVYLFDSNKMTTIYVLNQDVKKGESVELNKLNKIKVQYDSKIKAFNGNLDSKVFALDYESRYGIK